MGSVVFPEAGIKIYLDASIEVRAKRRQIQLKEKGMKVNMRNLTLEDRDKDKNREVSPLLIPNGAKVIDSTNLSIDESSKQNNGINLNYGTSKFRKTS